MKSKDGKTVSSQIDDLVEKAKRFNAHTEKSAKGSTHSQSSLEEAANSIKSVGESLSAGTRFLHNCKETGLGLYERILSPIWRTIRPPIRWIEKRYKRLWNRFAYSKDPKTGERTLSRARSSLLIVLTVLVISVFTPTMLGDAVRFFTTEPLLDGVLITFTKKVETFYLNNSQEVDPEANVHSVRGCKHAGQCSEKDAVYFKVLPRLSHDVWKLVTYGNPIYVPDHVVAPIAPGVNKCEVTYYGYRMTSSWIARLMRSFQLYPTMLEATCVSLGVKEVAPIVLSPD